MGVLMPKRKVKLKPMSTVAKPKSKAKAAPMSLATNVILKKPKAF